MLRQRVEHALRDLAGRAGLREVPGSVVGAVLVLAVATTAWAAWRWWPRASEARDASPALFEAGVVDSGGGAAPERQLLEPPGSESGSSAAAPGSVFVHVAGKVRRPGVYELPVGSRVVDGVEAAGGVVGDAAPDALNLARVLGDGEQVVVLSREEAKRGTPSGVSGGSAAGVAAPSGPRSLVNINTADKTQLDTLPGVGPSTAAKIVAEREANGPFQSAEDLGRVSGIGPKRLDQLKDLVCVK